jgi:hypothetical protein
MPCHHFREEKVFGETKGICALCGQIVRGNSGIMTMHYRLMHNSMTSDVSSNHIQPKQVDGVLKVVRTLCGRALRRNSHLMEVHYKMVHHPLTAVPRHVCSLQRQSYEGGNSAMETCITGALCDNGCNIDGMTAQADRATEHLQWIDSLAQRYPRIWADPEVCRSMLVKAPPGARQILARWLTERAKPLHDGACPAPPHV